MSNNWCKECEHLAIPCAACEEKASKERLERLERIKTPIAASLPGRATHFEHTPGKLACGLVSSSALRTSEFPRVDCNSCRRRALARRFV